MNQSPGGDPFTPQAGGFPLWLCRAAAGLDAGFWGAVAVLSWFIGASLASGGFWFGRLNLAAGPFFGDKVFGSGAGWHTLTGAALLLVLYSLLGVVYSALPASREGWLNLLTALGYAGLVHLCADAWLWKRLHPFAPPYFAPLAVAPGHLLYGIALWRYPARLKSLTIRLGDERSVAVLARPPAIVESGLRGEEENPAVQPAKDEGTGTPAGPAELLPPDGGPPPSSLE